MRAGKMDSSTECPPAGTPRATLRESLNGWRSVRLPGLGSKGQSKDRIPQEKRQLRRIEEPECWTEKRKSLVMWCKMVQQIIVSPPGESPINGFI
jgi:hypothetical protein